MFFVDDFANALTSFFGGDPKILNSNGDQLTFGDAKEVMAMPLDVRMRIFSNWLTAGGAPKPVDPGVALAKSAAMAGAYQKAGAGRGVGGLFGLGKLAPNVPTMPTVPLDSTKPLAAPFTPAPGGGNPNSPMRPGVPYAAAPIPKLFGGR